MFKKGVKFFCFSLLLSLEFLSAQSFLDPEDLNTFYDEFVCEEKNITSDVRLTQPCTELPPGPPSPPLPPSPPSPPAPPSLVGYLPIVLVNNTGLPNSEVYFVVFGTQVSSCQGKSPCPCPVGQQTFVSFGPQPGPTTSIGSIGGDKIPSGTNIPPASQYSYRFSDFTASGPVTIYIPVGLQGGEILFSISNPLPLTVNNFHPAGPNIAVPNPSLATDPSYLIVYGQFEFTLFPPNCQDPSNRVASLNELSFDITNVDYFGLPIQFTLQPQNFTAGDLQTRHTIIESLKNAFNSAIGSVSQENWKRLIITDLGGKVLRILSPGESMFGPGIFTQQATMFDFNYFDNNSAYQYSWASNVWYGQGAYYRNNNLTIVTSTPNNFVGKVKQGTSDFVFISSKGDTYTIPWKNSPNLLEATSASLFNVSTHFPGMTYTPKGGTTPQTIVDNITAQNQVLPSNDATEITKMLSSAIIAGIIPGKTNKLTNSGPLNSLTNMYYTSNKDLPTPGSTTGPWFDLYSVGLIGAGAQYTGNIVYAYPYDDYLYSNSTTGLQDVAPSIFTITPETYIVIQLNEYSDN